MSDENSKPEDQPQDAPATEAAAEQPQEEAAASELDPIEVLKAESADWKDRAMRTMAEMENLRRRTEKEIKDARQYGVAGFARDMLTVSDNLHRALEALPEDDRKNADAGVAALIDGVEMIERDLLSQLEKHGVKKLEPEGQKFDPNFHQAMFEVPNTEVPNNTVVQVVQAGYVIGDRVLRAAMVGVAKGGPKDAAQPEGGAEAGQTVDKSA